MKNLLKKLSTLIYYNHKNEKNVSNLNQQRYKYTNKELDFTIIEIIDEEKISNYLEIDDYVNYNEYKNKTIFTYQYPNNSL